MTIDNNLTVNPIEIADGIYWVGYADNNAGLHCNPYLIIEGNEAVLIDGGSRDDFSSVMLKILRTGLNPSAISRLIYQHYDPDLCGSLPQLEAIINNEELKIISHAENNVFIHYYSSKTPKLDFRNLGGGFNFATGRRLDFCATPFYHAPGSFVTYDRQTGTLFSSDLFGSYDSNWSLFMRLDEDCKSCAAERLCKKTGKQCAVYGIQAFHRRIMTSTRALSHALDSIESLDIDRIAPPHGSIISKEDVKTVIRHLRPLKDIGIDYLLGEKAL